MAYNGHDALALAREIDPDVVVLDLALPGIDGLEVCRQLRTFSDAYVVMLTARDAEMDTIIGLSVGADDYVTKPFSPRELVARIRAMLRRPRTVAAPVPADDGDLRHGRSARCGSTSRVVRCSSTSEPIMLTRTEFDVLRRSRHGPAWSSVAGSFLRPFGQSRGSETSISSMFTSAICAASSAMTPPHRAM